MFRFRRNSGLCAFLILAGCAGGGGGEAQLPPTLALEGPGGAGRDIVLITIDTLRYDAVGYSSSGKIRTPASDRLARDGVAFRFAHAHATLTLPSHTSLLTGLNPSEHGVHDNSGYVLDPATPSLQKLLRERGYRTAAFVSALTLDRRFGLDNGFELYDDEYEGHPGPAITPPERSGARTVELALDWWREHRGEPRFLWVHTFTPHYPYAPSEPFASQYPDQPYYADAAMADSEIEPLVAELLDSSELPPIVVFTSDHGEGLGDHGEATHGLFAYEATLQVPLILTAPGLLAPAISDEPVRHVDLLPTLLDLVDVEIPQGLSGRSLFAPIDPERDNGSYFESLSPYLNRGWAPLVGRLEGRVKAIRLPIPELYRLDDDPRELRNLAESEAALYGRIVDPLPASIDAHAEHETPDPELVRRLRSLGYAAGGGGSPTDTFDASSDPKNLVQFDNWLSEGLRLYRDGKYDEAIAQLLRLIEAQPTMSLTYGHLAYVYTDLGRLEDAAALLEQAFRAGVAGEPLDRRYALIQLRLGGLEVARARIAPWAASLDPETQSAAGRIAAASGRFDEARKHFDRALELDPTFPTALADLGILEMNRSRFAEAEGWLDQALAQDPTLAEAWNGLGVIRAMRADPAGAIDAWSRALAIDPRLTDTLFNLGTTLAQTGRAGEALEVLERYADLVSPAEREQVQSMLRQLESASRSGH